MTLHWRGPGQPGWRPLAEGDLMGLPVTPAFVDDQGELSVTHKRGLAGYNVLSRE